MFLPIPYRSMYRRYSECPPRMHICISVVPMLYPIQTVSSHCQHTPCAEHIYSWQSFVLFFNRMAGQITWLVTKPTNYVSSEVLATRYPRIQGFAVVLSGESNEVQVRRSYPADSEGNNNVATRSCQYLLTFPFVVAALLLVTYSTVV